MSDNNLVVSDLVPYDEKNFIRVKEILKKLHGYSKQYSEMDNLYDLEGLETLKRGVTAQLEILAEHYSKIKKFKTMGDYLEETRKFVKSEAIALLVEESKNPKISVNQAEKVVYQSSYYKDRVNLMASIKAYFIKVEVMFHNYQTLLSSIVQSVSLCKKDANYKHVDNG